KACSGGRLYLYSLAAGGQPGVEKALGNLRAEIERDMKLMGVTSVDQLSRGNIRYRNQPYLKAAA
ncbi:MAG: alpha-hydroxy-acid oxidizing protein, partial [Pseudomonadota bacterium]